MLTDAGLRQLVAFISRMSSRDLAELEGVSAGRAHELVAGALVAEAAMRALRVAELEICPWALRKGVISIDLADREGEDDELARLLDATEYHVWALWLVGGQGEGPGGSRGRAA